MANVVFLWHMHQPYYVDPISKTARMPWVRLHCVKGYLDMVALLDDFEGIRVNFNLSPVLVQQIEELISGEVTDLWLEWARQPAAQLEDEQKFHLLENYFKINWDTMVKPFPRYFELLNKRGLTFYHDDIRRGIRYFSTQEYLDLQVWFNLAWCGFTARKIFPELRGLLEKGRNYTEEEKARVLQIHHEILKIVLLKYREAEMRNQVELTTNPYFHPILPLVYDTQIAACCLPKGRHLPKRAFSPDTADAQIRLAVDKHEAVFGRAPRGIWPAEGAVAPELLPLFQSNGFDYFCTDEENLFQSLKQEPAYRHARPDHLELFQGWRVRCEGATMNALFRERPLSDFIGFGAAKTEPQKAAAHLLHHLRHIAGLVPMSTGVIPLILDGENAWSSFVDGGEAFLRAVYAGIEADSAKLHSCTIQDYFAYHAPRKELTFLHSGSWIGANFDLWIGEDEENRAWEMLAETRAFLNKQIEAGRIAEPHKSAALNEIYAAEGSDWFWWYGSDFSSENDLLFDELFRLHLRNVYAHCGASYPPSLDQPIARGHQADPVFIPPTDLIQPEINGEFTSFFEWEGAGKLVEGKRSFRRSDRAVEQFYFGFSVERFYFRIDFRSWKNLAIELRFVQPKEIRLLIDPVTLGQPLSVRMETPEGTALSGGSAAARDTLECGVSLAELGLNAGDQVAFELRVLENGIEHERYPETGLVRCAVPDKAFRLANWWI